MSITIYTETILRQQARDDVKAQARASGQRLRYLEHHIEISSDWQRGISEETHLVTKARSKSGRVIEVRTIL